MYKYKLMFIKTYVYLFINKPVYTHYKGCTLTMRVWLYNAQKSDSKCFGMLLKYLKLSIGFIIRYPSSLIHKLKCRISLVCWCLNFVS